MGQSVAEINSEPLVSPVYGNFSNLPPMLLFASDCELLIDDTKRVVEIAKAARVEIEIRIYPGMPHAWPALGSLLPQGGKAIEESSRFFPKVTPDHAMFDHEA